MLLNFFLNDEIDVIICLLDDMDTISGLKPEERELYEKITRDNENNFEFNNDTKFYDDGYTKEYKR